MGLLVKLDGVGDATSSIQAQRGLSAVNLATPSIGGTMNIISDPTSQKFGVKLKQKFESGSFFKSTLQASSGMIGDWAFNAVAVRKTGSGIINKTWTDAWAYYFGASWNINTKNRLELYAIAPQRHGQNSYRQNIGFYSKQLAKDFGKELNGYDPAAMTKFFEVDRKYNENWSKVSSTYTGQQWFQGGAQDRFDPEFINERENYYHKPQINLNYYSQLSNVVSVYTTAYYSGGRGGGSGTLGSLVWDYSLPSRIVNYDATITRNKANATGSRGILRYSVNEQDQWGVYSKALFKLSNYMTAAVGVDWRTASIRHFREVRDLLSGSCL